MGEEIIVKQITLKDVGSAEGEMSFEAIASTYGKADRDGDVILEGAFDKSVAARRKVPMLFNHSWSKDNIIGKIEVLSTQGALKVKGTFDPTEPNAVDVYNKVKFGSIDSLSIGFILKDFEIKENTYVIKEVDLLEVSVVTIPANAEATIQSVKQLKEMEGEKNMELKELMEKVDKLEKTVNELEKKLEDTNDNVAKALEGIETKSNETEFQKLMGRIKGISKEEGEEE